MHHKNFDPTDCASHSHFPAGREKHTSSTRHAMHTSPDKPCWLASAKSSGDPSLHDCHAVTCCLGVRPDPGFGFGVGVPESGVGLDGASASGSLRQLDFCIRYLAIGRGCVAGHDSKAVDLDEGDGNE